MNIAQTPEPPYYAVIFTSIRTGNKVEEMRALDTKLVELAELQPGYLGYESTEEGLTVSYWESLEAIANWKKESLHSYAQEMGYSTFFREFKTRICKVEKDYSFNLTSIA